MLRRAVLVLLLLLGVYLVGLRRQSVPQAAGLQPALDLLSGGLDASPQYHRLLLQTCTRCARLYASSFRAPVPQATLDGLRLESDRAEAACEELIERAPDMPELVARLRRGAATLVSQLAAWQDEVRVRCGLALDQAPVKARNGMTV